MARQARQKSEFGTYHIVQHGGNCRNLFESDDDRNKFISIIEKAQRKNGFILHGFCILDSNSYDLVLNVNGGDLSKIMKSINIAYAMYAKCKGKLFNDRYKSYELDGPLELYETKRFIRNKVSKEGATCYNMCFEKVEPSSDGLIDFDDCDNCITCMDIAKEKLDYIALKKGLTREILLSDKEMRNQLIKEFRKNSTLSMKNIGILFGGISESSVSKILSS